MATFTLARRKQLALPNARWRSGGRASSREIGDLPVLLMAWSGLLVFGLVMVGSASVALDQAYLGKHFLYLALALIGSAVVYAMPLIVWDKLYLLAWAGAGFLCVLVLFFGHEVNGAKRWIRLGGFSLQAAEVAKFCLLVYLCGYLTRYREKLAAEPRQILIPLFFVAVIAALIVSHRDLGSAVVIVAAAIALLFVAGARLTYLVGLALACAAILAWLIWVEPYRWERLITFLDPWPKAFDSGYQLTQALIAFGRGEWFGLGLGEGIQKLFYLPEAHNDFIFAVIAEELGIVGALALTGLFTFFVVKLCAVGRRLVDKQMLFGGYACYFTALIVGVQFLVHIGVNTGGLPTKGLTLPFVSFGGNSLIICCAMFAVALRALLEESRDG